MCGPWDSEPKDGGPLRAALLAALACVGQAPCSRLSAPCLSQACVTWVKSELSSQGRRQQEVRGMGLIKRLHQCGQERAVQLQVGSLRAWHCLLEAAEAAARMGELMAAAA